jgi:nitrogen fixation protein FixH
MSLWITLFGGMILAAVLYGVARALRLSNFWAAVLAAGVPCVAYAVHVARAWPGLDVVTLNLIAYPTIAVLLFQLYGDKAQHARSMHWAPKLMIAFFIVLSVLFGALIYIAGQGLPPSVARWFLPNAQDKTLHTGFAGVVAHRQEDAAKDIPHHLRNEYTLRKLGWRLEIDGLETLRAGVAGDVRVRVLNRDGQGVDGIGIDLALARPGDAPANPVAFNGVGGGDYHARVDVSGSGTWVAFTRLTSGKESVRLERTIEVR